MKTKIIRTISEHDLKLIAVLAPNLSVEIIKDYDEIILGKAFYDVKISGSDDIVDKLTDLYDEVFDDVLNSEDEAHL